MSYTNASLASGEHIVKLTSVTWWITIKWTLIGLTFAPFTFSLTLLLPLIPMIERYFTEYAVTSHGVLVKRGIIRRKVSRISMKKVEGVDLRQTILGRIFNYGTIVVRGTGSDAVVFHMVPSPLGFQSLINDQIDVLK
jgi:membrane protein YdbS with pleckstrin-like domain